MNETDAAATSPPAGLARLRRLPLGAVRPRGWLQAQMMRDLEQGFAGCLDHLSPHVARDLFAGRLGDAATHAGWWDAESRGNWLWGYTMLGHLGAVAAHRERADELVAALRSTQDRDGYIGIYEPAARYPAGGLENGELWAQSRALMTLIGHFELTGDARSLGAARRAADVTLQQYGELRPHFGRSSTLEDRTGLTHGLCYVDALEALHENTGDGRYLDFARWLLRDFDAWEVPFPNDDLAAANLAHAERPLRGHAVHTVEHLRALLAEGPASSERIRAALRKIRLSTTPSGAVVGDESLHGLAGPAAGYEYCTLVELLFSLGRLAQRTADPCFGDWMERLAFNAAQGARRADGRALSYLCSDTRIDALASRPDSYSLLTGRHGRYKLSPTHDDVACCCNPNSTRLLPHYLGAMWLARADAPGLVALAYGPSELCTRLGDGTVVVRQQTGYPFEDRVRFSVDVATPLSMSLHLRRPRWARAACLTGVASEERDGWVVVDREWRGRTEFELRFDFPVGAESYPEGEVAVVRGPLQFVEPIPHEARVMGNPGHPTWCDEEWLPADARDVAAALPLLDLDRADLGFTVERRGDCADDDPWTTAPIRLRAPGLAIVPMGSAPLRRAAFLAARRTRAPISAR
ncbi:MAG: hypothetical protein FIB04_10350 [Gammaproteobacteria bacterium]|nr:hypothetical protein [Gammaproteobacteria bacterium]